MLEIYLANQMLSMPSSSSLIPSADNHEKLHIILSNNGTFTISSSLWITIFNHPYLCSLTLINLRLSQDDATMLAHYIREQTHLVKLVFVSLDQLSYILDEGIQKNRSITRLLLCDFETLDMTPVINLIKFNQSVEYLSLRHNHITDEDAAMIIDALWSNVHLKSLDISQNQITSTGALAFANLFEQEQHPSLKYLNLLDNDIDTETQQLLSLQCEDRIQFTFASETEPILTATQSSRGNPSRRSKTQFLSIILITCLFFLWGVPYQLNNVLIRQFMKLFVLNRFEASLVQSAFYLGYFVLALPAAYVLRRWDYKLGIILGFLLFGIGAFLFWPAALTGQYSPFLLALFVLAAGLAFLETAANPYIANAAGPMETSEKRLNIAQAFNPLGAIVGALMGTWFVFTDENEVQQMNDKRIYNEYLKDETLRVVQPYAILGGVAFLWAILIAVVPMPSYGKTSQMHHNTAFYRESHLRRGLFLFSLLAQFVYMAAQVGTWSFFMQYVQDYVEVNEQTSSYLLTSTFAFFALGRLTAALFMHYGYSPPLLLTTCGLINVLLIVITILVPNSIGVTTLMFTSFFMAPMFPTIFALGIKDMDRQTAKLASCFLVMTFIAGAICPSMMNLILVGTKRVAFAYLVPGGAYMIVALFGLFAYTKRKKQKNKLTLPTINT